MELCLSAQQYFYVRALAICLLLYRIQGFSFTCQLQPRSLLARVYETVIVCFLVIVLLVAITDVFYSLVLAENYSLSLSILYVTSLSTPLLYSFVSLCGVFLLLISTPVGFAKMFDLFSSSMITARKGGTGTTSAATSPTTHTLNKSSSFSALAAAERLQAMTCLRQQARQNLASSSTPKRPYYHLNGYAGSPSKKLSYRQELMWKHRRKLNLGVFCSKKSGSNTTCKKWMFTSAELPEIPFSDADSAFADDTLCIHGGDKHSTVAVWFQSIAGVCAICGGAFPPHFWCGWCNSGEHYYFVYNVGRTRSRGKTSMTCIIANCATVLLLSSALPVMARTLGITSIDLLGAYGSLNWISNFSLVCQQIYSPCPQRADEKIVFIGTAQELYEQRSFRRV
uniref:Uncharacterized protein n=1 Tax=Ditylenchus dipsaci TaxID=166011 RepID=A0A915EHN3_9BILA